MEIARFYLVNRVVVKLILFAHVTQSSYYNKPELILLKKFVNYVERNLRQ